MDQPPISKPFQLAEDLVVIPIDHGRAKLIMDACDPPGTNVGESIELRAPLYAFARYEPPRKPLHGWDPDERLQTCIAISRLVRPTSLSFGYSVRLIGNLASDFELVPGPVRSFASRAWTSVPEHDWLTLADLEQLRSLLTDLSANPFPMKSRLQQALWYFEYAARTELIDLRWLFIATAIETLLSSDSSLSTRRFTKRIPRIAAMLGMEVSPTDASRMWKLRSAISHGSKHGGLGTAEFDLYRRMEDIPRGILRRAIADLGFCRVFDSKESLDIAFPIGDPLPRTYPL